MGFELSDENKLGTIHNRIISCRKYRNTFLAFANERRLLVMCTTYSKSEM